MVSVLVPVLLLGILLSCNLSQVRGDLLKEHHMSKDLVSALQQQISEELMASNNYLAMTAYFGGEKVNRPGFAKLFKESAERDFKHAQKLIHYLNMRGSGSLEKNNLRTDPPVEVKWRDGIHALHHALEMEGRITEKLNAIHSNGSEDGHLTNFLESEFLEIQVNVMRRLSGYVRNLHDMVHGGSAENARNNLAEYLFDLQLQREKDEL